MNNIENAPEKLFNWLNQYDFEHLNIEQQKLVLEFMSREDYVNMRSASIIISGNGTHELSRKEVIRQDLMMRFDKQHSSGKPVPLSQSLAWKAAAIFLAIAVPLSVYLLFKSNKQMLSNQANNRVDTVYLENSLQQTKVHDTVYIIKEVKSENANRINKRDKINVYPVDEVNVKLQSEIRIQNIQDVNSVPNTPKRNNIKDDTLISNFNFVTL